MNSSTYYTLNSGVTPNDSCKYYVGCSLNSVAPIVRIIVTDLTTGENLVNLFDYDVQFSNHYFDANNDRSYAVYVNSGTTTGWALCEPAN